MSVPSLPLVERSLWFLGLILSLILSFRLIRLKLARAYGFFLCYLLFNTARSLVMWPLSWTSQVYNVIWRWTEPVIWVLFVLVVLELCGLAFKEYRGIQALGRWTIYGSLVVALIFSTLSLLPTWVGSNSPAYSTQRFLMVERGIDFCLVLLLLIVLASLVLFPIRLTKNVTLHAILYSAYFTSNSIGIFIANVTGPHLFAIVSCCLMGVQAVCLTLWVALLSREGETKTMVLRPPVAADEERLVEQLASINATLLRASGKANPFHKVYR
jgi:hypothetical protein